LAAGLTGDAPLSENRACPIPRPGVVHSGTSKRRSDPEGLMLRLRYLALAAPLILAACSQATPEVPDLSGIWTMDPQGRAGAALNGVGDFEATAPFTPEARARLAE